MDATAEIVESALVELRAGEPIGLCVRPAPDRQLHPARPARRSYRFLVIGHRWIGMQGSEMDRGGDVCSCLPEATTIDGR